MSYFLKFYESHLTPKNNLQKAGRLFLSAIDRMVLRDEKQVAEISEIIEKTIDAMNAKSKANPLRCYRNRFASDNGDTSYDIYGVGNVKIYKASNSPLEELSERIEKELER